MFIYQEVEYNKYTYKTIKIGINLYKRTLKIKHNYVSIDRKKYHTTITETAEAVQFLEHLIALVTPAQDEEDERRIKEIKPLLNHKYLPVDIECDTYKLNVDIACPDYQTNHDAKQIGLIVRAGKNFTTGQEILELHHTCVKAKLPETPEINNYFPTHGKRIPTLGYHSITYKQENLNLALIPEDLKAIWRPRYSKATRL
jgi:hypothetical protein